MNEHVRMLRAHQARSATQEQHKGDLWFDHYQKYATEIDGARRAWASVDKHIIQAILRGKHIIQAILRGKPDD
jgi:hypothetical protein